MRSEHQRRVDTFMRLAGQDVPETPTKLDKDGRKLRARLILEEAMETIAALKVDLYLAIDSDTEVEIDYDKVSFWAYTGDDELVDLAEVIDGCVDLSVVSIGTLSACGIPDEPFLREVDQNNLDKIANGTRDEHGKFKKHPDHKPPRIAEILESLA